MDCAPGLAAVEQVKANIAVQQFSGTRPWGTLHSSSIRSEVRTPEYFAPVLTGIEQVKANMGVAPVLTAIQQNKTLVSFAPVFDAFRSEHDRTEVHTPQWILPL